MSIWEFPASALVMTVAVGDVPVPEHTWTVFGPKPDVSLRSAVSANPFDSQFMLRAKTTNRAVFPNLPAGGTSVGYGSFILRGGAGLVNNGALALPTQPSDIDLNSASRTREGTIKARPHPFIYDQGWRFKYEIESHIVGTPGSDQYLPILPVNSELHEDGGWDFVDAPGDGNWFDPPMVDSYRYQTDGQSNFTAVKLPTGIDADGQFTVTDAGVPTPVSEGVLHTFSSPTSQFTVGGINPQVDGGNPRAFPTYLEFDQAVVNFTQTPVPEPSTLALAALGLFGLLTFRQRRQ